MWASWRAMHDAMKPAFARVQRLGEVEGCQYGAAVGEIPHDIQAHCRRAQGDPALVIADQAMASHHALNLAGREVPVDRVGRGEPKPVTLAEDHVHNHRLCATLAVRPMAPAGRARERPCNANLHERTREPGKKLEIQQVGDQRDGSGPGFPDPDPSVRRFSFPSSAPPGRPPAGSRPCRSSASASCPPSASPGACACG